ncbi:hypothetical protein ABIA85_009048 [Bradyrhizobium sp. LA6.10]
MLFGVGEPCGLLWREHAERYARLHDNTFNGDNRVASRPGGFGVLRGGDHIRPIHPASRIQASVVMHALCAVGAVFRTTAGLDAEQACGFDVVWIEIVAMSGLAVKWEVGKWQRAKLSRLGAFPVAADRRAVAAAIAFDFQSPPRLSLNHIDDTIVRSPAEQHSCPVLNENYRRVAPGRCTYQAHSRLSRRISSQHRGTRNNTPRRPPLRQLADAYRGCAP